MHSSAIMRIIIILSVCSIVYSEYYDSFSGDKITKTRYDALQAMQLVPYCGIEVSPCDASAPRRIDGSCNNPHYPPRGATLTPYRRLLPPYFSAGGGLPTASSGKPLPLVRPLRVALLSDGRVASKNYTHMVTNYNVFITGDITSVHDTVNYVAFTRTCCDPGGDQDPRCLPIEVKDDDLHLRRSNVRCLNLTRAITYQRLGCVGDDVPPERVNTAAPMLDLSGVYGHDDNTARRGRTFSKGLLKSDVLQGKEWPPSGGRVCVNNELPLETRCHDSPSSGANSVLGLNLLVIWYYRSHNSIARHLSSLNPCWSDARLYYTAREINIAYYNHILYYELMPELLGWDYLVANEVIFPNGGHVADYAADLEPRVSIEYVTGTRWFHSIQEGRMKLYTKSGKLYDELLVVDLTLRTGLLAINNTIHGITQGTFRQAGGDVDSVVDPDMGERVLGRLQFASDVVSSDIMKGRNMGLQPYNEYRKLCGLPQAKKFKDLLDWMEKPQVEAFASFYEHPSDIDLMAGLYAENSAPGAVVGDTLRCIMADQLRYWRRSDRFWYQRAGHPGSFTPEQLWEITKMSMAKLLCLHGDGVDAVQPNAFILPGHENEIKDCSKYEMPNLDVFRDDKCYHRPSKHSEYAPMEFTQHFGEKAFSQPIIREDYISTNQKSQYPTNQERSNENSKMPRLLYPNLNPKVTIFPNAEAVPHKLQKSEDQNSRHENPVFILKNAYSNNNPFEEFSKYV